MTDREKAKEFIVQSVKDNVDIAKVAEAIQILEQQPCEDCISREDVNTLVDELARAISDERCCISRGRSTATIMQDILNLSSVTPTRLKGKWIDDSKEDSYYANCSHCDYQIDTHYERGYLNYCPNCGAKMEVEE
jgi:hypothetical protein